MESQDGGQLRTTTARDLMEMMDKILINTLNGQKMWPSGRGTTSREGREKLFQNWSRPIRTRTWTRTRTRTRARRGTLLKTQSEETLQDQRFWSLRSVRWVIVSLLCSRLLPQAGCFPCQFPSSCPYVFPLVFAPCGSLGFLFILWILHFQPINPVGADENPS